MAASEPDQATVAPPGDEGQPPSKRRWWLGWRGVACLVLVLSLIGFAIWTDRPGVRYAEYARQCAMIFVQKGPIDLAVIGSSRSMRAFQADLLADAVDEAHGFQPTIHDLSRAYRDPAHMLRFVEDAAAHHRIRFLLVEFKETGPQWRHPHFERNVTIGDIGGAYLSRPSVDPVLRLQAALRDGLDRLTYRATKLIKEETATDCSDHAAQPATTTDPSRPWVIDAPLIRRLEEKQEEPWERKPLYSFDLDATTEDRNRHYMAMFADLARREQIDLFYYYIPPLFGRPLAPDFIAGFEERFGAPLLQLDATALATLQPLGFTDGTHMGWPAASVYMRYLAEALPWQKARSSE